MNEMNSNLPPTLDAVLTEFYKGPRPDSAFAVRLEAQLRQHQTQMLFTRQKSIFSFSNSKRSLMQTLRARPILAFLAAILALLMLTGMAYAVGRLTGFIPGFGFSSNTGAVFILAEPVESSKAGITLRIDNAVSDDTRFWAAFTVKGLTGQETITQIFVLLPDGKKVQMTVGGMTSSPHGDIQISCTIPALPSGTQSLTIRIENLEGQNYPLALRLRPVKSDEIIPVQPTGTGPEPSEALNGLRLVLENIALTSDRTVFQVSLQFDRKDIGIGAFWSITLTDEEGRVYPVKDITPLSRTDGNARIYETVSFRGNEQLTVSLVTFPDGEALPVIEDFSSKDMPGFRFNPGPIPEVGQSWTLNETMSVGSFKLHVIGAKLTAESGLVFEFEAAGDVTGVMLYTADPRLRDSTGGVPFQNKNFTSSIKFDTIPTQPFDVHIRSVYFTIHGPWKIKWQPPAAPTPDIPVPTPTKTASISSQFTPTPESTDPIWTEVQRLAQIFDADFQKGPGWIHVVKETDSIPKAGQTYPPSYLKNEMWYEIDADGFVIRSVYTDRSSSGLILQQAATVGNYSMNFTYGQSGYNNGQRYLISLGLWPNTKSEAMQKNPEYSQEQGLCENGKPCLKITERNWFNSPIQNTGETEIYSGAGGRLWIDLQTGQQVKAEAIWILKDGKEAVTSIVRVVLVEKVASPPPEILAVLAKVVVP